MKQRFPPRLMWRLALALGFTLSIFLLLVPVNFSSAQEQGKGASRQLQQTETVTSWPGKAKRWALVVGIDQYRDVNISPLRGAANDAGRLARALKDYAGFSADQVILLATDQPEERQPTRINILTYLSNIASAVPKDGLLLVAFAGHGIERGGRAFLIPSDARLTDDVSLLEESSISLERVNQRIRAADVAQVVVLLDACRNDPGGRADAPNPLTPAYVRGFSFDVRNRGVQAFATIYATAVGQRAYEYPEKRQGYFTWAVVEGLKGGAANERGEVTLAGLVKYVQDVVPKRIVIDLGAGKQQRPFAVIEGYRADELVVATVAPKGATGSAGNVTNKPRGTLDDEGAVEAEYWESIRTSTDAADYQEYLKEYPQGRYAQLARLRLRQIEAEKSRNNTQAGGVAVDTASKLDLLTATAILDRAIKAKDGSKQGQVAAMEELLRRGFSYKNTSFDGVSFEGAVMHGADFSSSSFVDGDLSNTQFNGGKLDSADLNFANLQGASFRNVSAKEAYFQYTQADSAQFEGATLNQSSFFLSRLRGANFRNAKLRGVCLAYCDLTGADFTGADLTDAIIFSSVLDKAKFDGAIINNTDVGASVARTISFTPEQRSELRRSSPLSRFIDIKIWGHARQTRDWDASYPDFNSYHTKLVKIPEMLRGSLKFRNKDSLQPVGPFRDYTRNGSNDIRASHWFDADFWSQGKRSQRLKKRLEDYANFLFEEISSQPPIEGSGQEMKAWMSFIEKKSEAVSYSGPLILTGDAYMTLLLSKGLISPTDISEYDWKKLAVERCVGDAKYKANYRSDSWLPMYPPESMCYMLPPTHVDAYKKWTIARAKHQGFQQIEVVYFSNLVNLGQAQRLAGGGKSGERILIFNEFKDSSKGLDNDMKPNSSEGENPELLLGLPREVSSSYPLLKLPAARSSYTIAMSPGQAPSPKPGKGFFDTYFQFRVVFDLSGITKRGRTYVLAAIPKKAAIEVDGNRIWEGPILLSGDGK